MYYALLSASKTPRNSLDSRINMGVVIMLEMDLCIDGMKIQKRWWSCEDLIPDDFFTDYHSVLVCELMLLL